jgi:hypothetical protein
VQAGINARTTPAVRAEIAASCDQGLLTDNGKAFTDRLFASRQREPSGNHEIDPLCKELGLEHRFDGREDLEQSLLRYVALYNPQLPQSAHKGRTPIQAMKEWRQSPRSCSTRGHMVVRDVDT